MISQRYAIFDMDGTLVDSMPYWRNILPEYLRRPIPDSYIQQIAAMNVTDSIALTVKTFNLSKTPDTIFNEICAIMHRHYINDVNLKNGVAEYLKHLSSNGVRMCVASASPGALITAVLERFNLTDFFEFTCSTEDGFADKRNPDIYLFCAEKFQAFPHEVAVFEDSYSAIKTAAGANFPVIAVYDKTAEHHWQEIKQIAVKTKRDGFMIL